MALILPLIYIFFIRQDEVLTEQKTISDGQGTFYTVYYSMSHILLVKWDGAGEIFGTWQTSRTNGYSYIEAEAVNVYHGEFYCVLTEINSRNFIIENRQWLKINFEDSFAETIYQKKYGNIQNAYSTSLRISDGKMYTVSALTDTIRITDVYSDEERELDLREKAFEDCSVVNYAAALSDGKVIFSDILDRIYITDCSNLPHLIYQAPAGSFYDLSVDNDGFCTIRSSETNEVFSSVSNEYTEEKIEFVPAKVCETALDPNELFADKTVFYGNFFAFCAADAGAGLLVFVLLSLKRIPIFLKISLIIALALGAGGIVLFMLTNSDMEEIHLKSNLEKAYMSAKILEAEIDLERFENIDWNCPEQDGYFSELCRLMEYSSKSDKIKTVLENGDLDEEAFGDKNYCWIYPVINGGIRSGICDQYPVNMPFETIVSEKLTDYYDKVAKGSLKAVACGIYDGDFEWVISVYPLKNKDGDIIALIETGISKYNYMMTSKMNSAKMLFIVAAFEIGTGVLIIAAVIVTLFPLKKLHKAVDETRSGNYGVTVTVRGHDEIASIAQAFNEMSAQIYNHTQSLNELNESYLRFLPSGILDTIGKTSVLSVSRGDYSSVNSYILHILLPDFSAQTEKLSNDGAFDLINRLSKEVMESVIQRKGVVESYNQEEYICIFNEPDPAYEAAVSLIRRLRSLYPALKTAFVIVRDSVLLGIVGHEKRLGTIMLSRSIRLSKELGGIAALCGSNLVVTSDIPISASRPKRFLGKIGFDGREYAFFDCFEGDEASAYLNKLNGRAKFEKITDKFYRGEWGECRRMVLAYLEKYSGDSAAIRYLFLCENNIENPEEKAGIGSIIT